MGENLTPYGFVGDMSPMTSGRHGSGSPGSQVRSPKSLEGNLIIVERMEVGIYRFMWDFQVLSPKYDMDAYVATLFGGEVRLETCVGSWVGRKARPNFQHKSRKYLCMK